MSSKNKEDFLPITKEEFTTQIIGNNVTGCLKNYLTQQYQSLRKSNIATMKNWIVSLPEK